MIELLVHGYELKFRTGILGVVGQLRVGWLRSDDLAAVAPVEKPEGAQQLSRPGAHYDVIGGHAFRMGEHLNELSDFLIRIAARARNRATDNRTCRRRGPVGILVPA